MILDRSSLGNLMLIKMSFRLHKRRFSPSWIFSAAKLAVSFHVMAKKYSDRAEEATILRPRCDLNIGKKLSIHV